RFLHELLRAGLSPDVEEVKPRPRRIDEVVPTEAYEADGQIGGYIDIHIKRFTGNVAELLPIELALLPHKARAHRALLAHKLFNEGVLTYVREDFERLDKELRVLICLVVDAHRGMSDVPADAHPSFGRGLTPYVRARTLAALFLQDLARYMPR